MIEASEFVNQAAVFTQQAMDSDAVVLLSLRPNNVGELELLIGSTGTKSAILFLASRLPQIADALRRAADSSTGRLRHEFEVRPDAN